MGISHNDKLPKRLNLGQGGQKGGWDQSISLHPLLTSKALAEITLGIMGAALLAYLTPHASLNSYKTFINLLNKDS